jgi:DNA-binding MarR family transcriptional regulator
MTYADRDRISKWLRSGEGGNGLKPLDRGVLLTLAELINSESRLSYPGPKLLAAEWGVSVSGVEKALARLRSAGLIVVAEQAHRGRRASYRVNLPAENALTAVRALGSEKATPQGGASAPRLRFVYGWLS